MQVSRFNRDNKDIDRNEFSTVRSFDVDENRGRVGDANAPDISIVEVLSLFLVAGLAFTCASSGNELIKLASSKLEIMKRRQLLSKLIQFLVIVLVSILIIYLLYYITGFNVASTFIRR